MSNLFSFGDVKNHPRRSGFDLSRRICFTSKAGELLPVYYKFCYPGDKFQLRHQMFTRTQPVNTAAYTRIREYLDWYFVPIRLINKNLPQALTFMQNNPVLATGIGANKVVTTDIPWTVLGNDGQDVGARGIASFFSYMYSGAYEQQIKPVVNFFGFNAGSLGAKLAMMLRYGNFISPSYSSDDDANASFGLSKSKDFTLRASNTNYAVNILPFAAYQKIYADHFRNTQWEKNEAYTYNFDWYSGGNIFDSFPQGFSESLKEYVEGSNLFTLRYANWPKDLFMGVMPNSQLGEVSVVSVTSAGTGSVSYPVSLFSYSTGKEGVINELGAPIKGAPFNLAESLGSKDNYDIDFGTQKWDSATSAVEWVGERNVGAGALGVTIPGSQFAASFSVLQLRMAEAVQKYREVSQVADQTARDQIYAHFGVTLSPALSDQCFRIGGSVSNIDISEVVNNFLPNATPGQDFDANIKGKGVGSGQGSENFSTDEYGILMAIYHVSPLLDYVITGQPQDLLYTDTQDLPFPEFDSIGMQSLHFGRFANVKDLFTSPSGADYTKQVMGYTPRYIDLKTDYDEVYGAFRSTLKSWVAPLDPLYLKDWIDYSVDSGTESFSLNYGFFKVNPKVLNSIFRVQCDDTLDS